MEAIDSQCLFFAAFDRYYLRDPSGKVVEQQKGVVRTNCIDCLDRTNVTQVRLCAPISLVFNAAFAFRFIRLVLDAIYQEPLFFD